MAPSHRPSLRGPRSGPPLSAIVHSSHPVTFDDGLFLPSSCHGRTWLLDSTEEPCSLSGVPSLEPKPCPRDTGMPGTCVPGVVHAAGSHASTCERTTCPSGGSSAESRCESQPCASASSQPAGFALESRPPGSHGAKPCLPQAHVSTKCPAPECGPSQGHSQGPGSRSCGPLVPVTSGPQLPGPSCNADEPRCCVTGGW
ncbi:keratin-associated protein 27-1-like [Sturnira hondurensis]|uniref:keratin-associated protein 27-1-like n=1 Tax=Sturnira hondurensis TaxID=192404 RepID=UPI0018797AC6|nr:keratin-associated protein 27-1-like [Sturnira hondurensis]